MLIAFYITVIFDFECCDTPQNQDKSELLDFDVPGIRPPGDDSWIRTSLQILNKMWEKNRAKKSRIIAPWKEKYLRP